MDWEAFRPCDAMVESAIAEGAYREALDTLVRGYQRVIISYCRKRLGAGGSAEEVAQEIFLKAYRIMPQKGHAPVRPWLFAIARLRCLSRWDKDIRRDVLAQTHRHTIEESAHQSVPTTPEERVLSEADLDALRTSLTKLRKWDRELIEKRFLEECTIATVARDFNWSETKVRNRLAEALTRLQAIYRQLTEES